jgi:DNA-binding beta-propeller fold protein YncE
MKRLVLVGLVGALAATASLSAQAPAAPATCDAIGDVQFICGQNGPEDLVVVPGSQWVVASSYGGSGGVMLIRVSDRMSSVAYPGAAPKERLDAKTYNTCPGPPDAAFKAKFLTHGLYLQEGRNSVHTLYVVVHGGREAVEVFELDARSQTPALTWIGCAVAPEPIGLNSVRALPGGGFIATNFLPRGTQMASLQKGEKNGELWEWHTASGWQKVPGSEASGANGLEMSDDGKTLYVAAWGSQSFFRLSRGGAKPERQEVPLGFRVDNIRWAKDGSILAAGQGGNAPNFTTQVVKVDPKTLKVTEVVNRPAVGPFSAGTVAVEVGNQYWVGSFRGDRIALFNTK